MFAAGLGLGVSLAVGVLLFIQVSGEVYSGLVGFCWLKKWVLDTPPVVWGVSRSHFLYQQSGTRTVLEVDVCLVTKYLCVTRYFPSCAT